MTDVGDTESGTLTMPAVEQRCPPGAEENVTTQHGELLQTSSLEDFEWPLTDPHAVKQKVRLVGFHDLDLVKECIRSAEVNLEGFLKEKKQLSQAEKVVALLAHQKFQMNPVGKVKQEPKWRECVEKAMAAEVAIPIVYPQFCCIPNGPKRYTNTGPAAGEDCAIEFFKMINRQVREMYPHGVHFHILTDAALYASAFQTHQTEVDAYHAGVAERVQQLDTDKCITVYDYSEMLRTKCGMDYRNAYYTIGHRVWTGNLAELLPNPEIIPTLRRSIRCSVNTRRFQLRHDEHRRLFGPQDARDKTHPFYDVIEKLTDLAFNEVITIRLACMEIDICSRLWPDAIRATCHKGPKNGRWPMGLRPYPEYYGSCKLLAYHGMPVISRNSKGKPKLEIEPEVRLRSRSDLVRVLSAESTAGQDEVYAYVAEDIDREYSQI